MLSSKPAGRCSPPLGRFDSCAAPLTKTCKTDCSRRTCCPSCQRPPGRSGNRQRATLERLRSLGCSVLAVWLCPEVEPFPGSRGRTEKAPPIRRSGPESAIWGTWRARRGRNPVAPCRPQRSASTVTRRHHSSGQRTAGWSKPSTASGTPLDRPMNPGRFRCDHRLNPNLDNRNLISGVVHVLVEGDHPWLVGLDEFDETRDAFARCQAAQA